MLAGAVRTYVNRYGVLAGRRAVVFTDDDDGWTTRSDLVAAGAAVAAIVDSREPDVVPDCAPVSRHPGHAGGGRGSRWTPRRRSRHRPSGASHADSASSLMSGGRIPPCTSRRITGDRPRWDDDVRPSFPTRCERYAVAGAAAAAWRWRQLVAGTAGCDCRGHRGFRGRRRTFERHRRPRARIIRPSGSGGHRQGLRRLPERRHRGRHRAGRRAKASAIPSTPSDTPPRHGDRPGQERGRQSGRRCWPKRDRNRTIAESRHHHASGRPSPCRSPGRHGGW